MDQNQLQEMLKKASQKLGTDPATLQKQLENGSVDDAIKHLQPADTAKLQSILNNPALTKQLLSSPQAKQLLQKLTEKK